MNKTHPSSLSFVKSLGFFGIPWLMFLLAVYGVIPTHFLYNVPSLIFIISAVLR